MPLGKYRKYISNKEARIPRTTRNRWKNNSIATVSGNREDNYTSSADTLQATDPDDTNPNTIINLLVENNGTCHVPEPINHCGNEDFNSNEDERIKEPLYPDCKITKFESAVAILSLIMKHNLSKCCLDDIIALIGLHLPPETDFFSSKFTFYNFIQSAPAPVKRHSFCSSCTYYLGKESELKASFVCPSCRKNICKTNSKELEYFYEIDIINSLKVHLENGRLFKHLSQSFEARRGKKPNGEKTFENIFDGQEYLKLKDLENENNFSLICNVDGVPIFKSSNKSLWPIQLSIPEVSSQFQKKYIIIAGLWYGCNKPDMNSFLFPLTQTLKKLHSKGFSWVHPVSKKTIVSKVFSQVFCVDAVARAPLLNMNQFNGQFGCGICEHPGEFEVSSRVYKYVEGIPNRTHESILIAANEALESETIVKGIKGFSVLSLIPELDLSKSLVPDYMHAVLLGVTRQFLSAMVNSKNHTEDFYLGNKTNRVDQKLLSIKPPRFLTRTSRSLSTMKNWKASEYRNFLLFYALPLLKGIIPFRFLKSIALLCNAIYLLLKSKIQGSDIDLAECLLKEFVKSVPLLYGNKFCTFNVHQLLHLSNTVRSWGPLWTTSAFIFEDNNQRIKKAFHGTQEINKQIIQYIHVNHALEIKKYSIKKNSPADSFLNNMTSSHSAMVETKMGEVSLIGKHKRKIFQTRIKAKLVEIGFPPTLNIYPRLKSGNIVYYSKEMHRAEKRNSYTVLFNSIMTPNVQALSRQNENYVGYILYFFGFNGSAYAVVQKFKLGMPPFRYQEPCNFKVSHLLKVESRSCDGICIIRASSIISQVIEVLEYVAIIPNFVEYIL